MDTLEALKAAWQEMRAAKAKTASAGFDHESVISPPGQGSLVTLNGRTRGEDRA